MCLVSASEFCFLCLHLSIYIFIHMFNKSKGENKNGNVQLEHKLFPLESVNAATIQKYYDALLLLM